MYIAPGAKLAGKIKIGDNVSIGANVVLERDIPDNAVVQLRPMLVVTFSHPSHKEPPCEATPTLLPTEEEVVVDNF